MGTSKAKKEVVAGGKDPGGGGVSCVVEIENATPPGANKTLSAHCTFWPKQPQPGMPTSIFDNQDAARIPAKGVLRLTTGILDVSVASLSVVLGVWTGDKEHVYTLEMKPGAGTIDSVRWRFDDSAPSGS